MNALMPGRSRGRSLPSATIERIARVTFPELDVAPVRELARRMGDVRDAIDGFQTLNQADFKRLEGALLALLGPQ